MQAEFFSHNDNQSNLKNFQPKKVNYAFTAMPLGIARHISGSAMQVLQEIMIAVFKYGSCTLSVLTIKNNLKSSKNKVINAKRELVEKGFIFETKRGSKSPSELTINYDKFVEVSKIEPQSHRQFLEDGEKSKMDKFKNEQKAYMQEKACNNIEQEHGQNLTIAPETEIPMVKNSTAHGQKLTIERSKIDLEHGQKLNPNKDPKNLKNIIKDVPEKMNQNTANQKTEYKGREHYPATANRGPLNPAMRIKAGGLSVKEQLAGFIAEQEQKGLKVDARQTNESEFSYYKRIKVQSFLTSL